MAGRAKVPVSCRNGQHPNPGAIKANNFDPRVPTIAEKKQRALLEVFAQPLPHQRVQPTNPLRMSQASTATNTFKLPEKLNMAWPGPRHQHHNRRQGRLFFIRHFHAHPAGRNSTTNAVAALSNLGWFNHGFQQP